MKGINVLPFGSNLRGINLPSRSLFSGFTIPSLGGKSDNGLFTKPLTPSQGGTDLSLGDAVLNMVTGNADYMRTLESMDIQNAFNAAEAEKSRDWQEHMRDTSLTSTINQLKENGLNPFLAYNSASVSTPSTSSAHSGSGGSFSSGKAFITLMLGLLSSAINISKMRQMSDLLDEKADYFSSLTRLNDAKADYWESLFDRHNRR